MSTGEEMFRNALALLSAGKTVAARLMMKKAAVKALKASRIQGCGATIAPDSELLSDQDLETVRC